MQARSRLGGLLVAVACSLAAPGALAQYVYFQPDGTGIPQTNRMQVILDARGEAIDAIDDAALVPETFYPSLTLTFTDLAEGAGYENIFGWYNVGDDISVETNRHPIFYTAYDHGYILPATCDAGSGCVDERCADPSCSQDPYDGHNSEPASAPWDTRTVSLCGDPRWKGGPIGFFIVTPEGIAGSTARNDIAGYEYMYFSEPRLNILEQGIDDPYIHHLTYQSSLDATAFYFGFEDLYRGGDNDFEDMLVLVEGLLVDAPLEICNDVDDDCDGQTDENVTQPCSTACGTGVEYCVGGAFDPDTCTARVPTGETCNGVDDDCDGDVDEALIQPCSSVCGSGVEFCVNGGWFGCTALQPTGEACDNLDNDCDGQTDEDLSRPCATTCGAGDETCDHGAWVDCTAELPGLEVCDGADNDCDGLTDEDLELGCSTVCGPGLRLCVDGAWADCSAPFPQPELCDDLDNDCDGQTDEYWPEKDTACEIWQGPCSAYGVLECNQAGNGLTCNGQILVQDEICDGADNDCDGAVDEDDPDLDSLCGACDAGEQPPCWSDEGTCEPGRMLCVAGELTCVGEIGPAGEECDLLDNDCDGQTDEDFADLDEICDDGIDNDCDGQTDLNDPECASVCDPGDEEPCGIDEGECRPGVRICGPDGTWGDCIGAVDPRPEECDGLDNDCDGQTDEDATPEICDDGFDNDCDGLVDGLDDDCGECSPGEVRTCGSDTGECAAGEQACNAQGHWGPCLGEIGPAPETCDGGDDDCDGLIDEGDLCDGFDLCLCGRCSSACSAGECPSGLSCIQGWCLADLCCGVTCPAGLTCQPGTGHCADPCLVDPPVCGDDQVCRLGACVPIDCHVTGHGCPDGQLCVDGACQADPCAAVDCPADQYCRQGACEDVACGDCQAGQVCQAGQCVESACAGVVCEGPGQVCVDGECAADPCRGVACPPGQLCSQGDCVQDACLAVTCPSDSHCEDGHCVPGEGQPDGGLDGGPDADGGADAGSDGGSDGADAGADAGADQGRPDAGADPSAPTGTGSLTGGCDCRAAQGNRPGGALMLLLAGLWAGLRGRRRVWLCLVLAGGLGLLPGCSSCDAGPDPADATYSCTSDQDCQAAYQCVAQVCVERRPCLDLDADGFCDHNDGGDDCNDNRPEIHPGAAESCNGLDDDCDGLVDEDCPCVEGDSQPCGDATGVCTLGTQACEDGAWGECDGGRGPDPEETCADLLDNDCDGAIDEGCGCEAGDSRPCGQEQGRCTAGVQVCEQASGVWQWSACRGGTPPVEEICGDGVDDDCDGSTDEACACPDGKVRNCGTNWGTCSAGTQRCANGHWTVCEGAVAPDDELCDGLDNDCDGLTDDGCECVEGIARTCGTDTGLCRTGIQRCDQGRWGECVGEILPALDLCDGDDNDCDGAVDEDFAELGQVCTAGLGQCAGTGRITCDPQDAGLTMCTASAGNPTPERCDGLDNDCDGDTDEDFAGVGGACQEGLGECAAFGTLVCKADGLGIVCNAVPGQPQSEVCDGLDNDCDGNFDENFPRLGVICVAGLGECQVLGTFGCSADGLSEECDAVPPAGGLETCNNEDDDCDGLTDEDLQTSCSNECGPGVTTCVGGGWIGCTAPLPMAELCDGLDNDCDTETDEDFDFSTSLEHCGGCLQQCAPPHGTGACAQGACQVATCDAGWHDLNGNAIDGCEYACNPTGAESCNGLDDDCDGQTDEEPGAPGISCLDQGVCSNVSPRCLAGGWQCLYPPAYEQTETLCDNLDNDCDGSTDEGFANKNQPCSAGQGICRRNGVVICTAGQDATECSATPDWAAQDVELCDALDNDCDGETDEELDDADEMVYIDAGPTPFWIDRWEASRPDATDSQRGFVTGYACAKPDVLPWDDVTWSEAKAICEVRSKRLCTDAEWRLACGGAGDLGFPYGDTYDPAACNTGTGAVSPGGAYAGCASEFSILDLSGNVAEWADCADPRDCRTVKPFFGGTFDDTLELMWTCWFRNNAGPSMHLVGLGFRCCKDG